MVNGFCGDQKGGNGVRFGCRDPEGVGGLSSQKHADGLHCLTVWASTGRLNPRHNTTALLSSSEETSITKRFGVGDGVGG